MKVKSSNVNRSLGRVKSLLLDLRFCPRSAPRHKTGPDKRVLEHKILLLCSVMVVATMAEIVSILHLLQGQLLMIVPRTSVLIILDRLNLSSCLLE